MRDKKKYMGIEQVLDCAGIIVRRGWTMAKNDVPICMSLCTQNNTRMEFTSVLFTLADVVLSPFQNPNKMNNE